MSALPSFVTTVPNRRGAGSDADEVLESPQSSLVTTVPSRGNIGSSADGAPVSAQPSLVTSVFDASRSGELVVRRIAGAGALAEMVFPIGRSAPPVSVGARGDWQVRGRGVAPVHAVLGSNGAGIFVRARDGARLSIDGVRVASSSWVPVPIGATIELGEVLLTVMMSRAGAPSSSQAPLSSMTTRTIRSAHTRSAEAPAEASAPTTERCVESPDAPCPPRDRRSATWVDPSDSQFGATTQIVVSPKPPSERDERSEDEAASSVDTTKLAPATTRGAPPVETGGPSFGTRQLVPIMRRGVHPADAMLRRSFGTTQIVPPIVHDMSAPISPPIDTARAPLVGGSRLSPYIHLPATDAYSDVPRPVVPAGPRSLASAPTGDGSSDVTQALPLTARRPPCGAGQSSHVFGSNAPMRLTRPPAQWQATPLVPPPLSGGHPLPNPMLGSGPRPMSPNGAGLYGPVPDDSGVRPTSNGVALGGPVPRDSGVRRVTDSVLRAWRSSSLQKRAIVVLLVPALLAAIASFGASVALSRASSSPPAALPAPVSVEPAPRSSNAVDDANTDDARAQSPAATALPAEEVGPRPAARSKGVQRTAERRALDAVAAGVGDAEEYDALASEYPDNPAFSEAARILRRRAADAAVMSSRSVKGAPTR